MCSFLANRYNDLSLNHYLADMSLCIVILPCPCSCAAVLKDFNPQTRSTSQVFSAIADVLGLSFMPKSDFAHDKATLTISGSGYCLLLSFNAIFFLKRCL